MKIGRPNFQGGSRCTSPDTSLIGPVLERTNGVPHGIVSVRQAQCHVAVEETYEGYETNLEPFPPFDPPDSDPPTPTPALLSLPKSVRECIYAYALTYKEQISIHHHNAIVHWVDSTCQKRICRVSFNFSPPLLRSCVQIQVEAAPIFFASNTFRADIPDGDITDLLGWLNGVPSAYLSLVRELVLNIEPTCLADVAELSSRAADLEGMREVARLFTGAVGRAGFAAEIIQVEMPVPELLEGEESVWGVGVEVACEVADRWINGLMEELARLSEMEEMVGIFEGVEMATTGVGDVKVR